MTEHVTLLPDIPMPLRTFEVTVPRDADSDALVPGCVPHGKNIMAAWTANTAQIVTSVRAPSLLEAAVLGIAAAGEYGRDPRAAVEVRPVHHSGTSNMPASRMALSDSSTLSSSIP